MKIAKNTVVTVHYKLSDAQGNLIEESREPMVYLHGGYENTLPKIEQALEGKDVGFETTIQVEPDDAFGELGGFFRDERPGHGKEISPDRGRVQRFPAKGGAGSRDRVS